MQKSKHVYRQFTGSSRIFHGLWVKRFLERHDHPVLRSDHQIAFMVIEGQRRHQQDQAPIEWPADIALEQILPFIDQRLIQL